MYFFVRCSIKKRAEYNDIIAQLETFDSAKRTPLDYKRARLFQIIRYEGVPPFLATRTKDVKEARDKSGNVLLAKLKKVIIISSFSFNYLNQL